MVSFEEYSARDARLIILRGLSTETDGTLNETLLTMLLRTFGHNRSRDYVRTQIRKMEELGAVTVTEAGSVLIPSITRAGLDHVERRSIVEGIARPSPEV
jgi:repressor of nif and glnA expression